jgi:hypothetical protein
MGVMTSHLLETSLVLQTVLCWPAVQLQYSKEHTMTYQLTNLTVVTGASSDIGAEIARRLAARKARLLLTGRDAGPLRAVAGSLDPAKPGPGLTPGGPPSSRAHTPARTLLAGVRGWR